MLKDFFRDCRGASSAEYALIIAILGIGFGAASLVLGNNVVAAMGQGSNHVHAANAAKATGLSKQWTGADGAPDGVGSAGGNGNANAGGNAGGNSDDAHAAAPGQNPGPGHGNSQGNQYPGSPPPKGKNKSH